MRVRWLWALALLAALGSSHAAAEEGVVELHPLCAIHEGCLPGDAPGFPISLGAGTYRLTANLVVGDADVDAIDVLADGVRIELSGFEIVGPVVCTGEGTAVSCAPAGTGRGIDAFGRSGLHVSDGIVRGFADRGIYAGSRARVVRVGVESNGGTGLQLGSASIVREVMAFANGGSGILGGDATAVGASVVLGNRFDGLQLNVGASIVGVASGGNGDDGINTGVGAVVRESTAHQNADDGIDVGSGSLVSACGASENQGDGISTTGAIDALVRRNVVAANGGFGLRLGSEASYRENTITTLNTQTVTGGVDLGANACDGAPTCP